MPEQKFKPTEIPVDGFLAKIKDEGVRDDCYALIKMMKKITGHDPKLWGTIVGFGRYDYKYESGHEGYSCLAGFAPRKPNIVIYVMTDLARPELLKKLGKYKASKGCLYIKRLEDVDTKVLETLIANGVKSVQKKFPDKPAKG